MNIVFYNNFHLGDIHLSRSLVKRISSFFKNEHNFFYAHKNHKDLLKDIQFVTYLSGVINICPIEPSSFIKNHELYFNTWYAANKFEYMNKYGLSFDCLYHLFDDVCQKELNIKLSEISSNILDFFPDIDFYYFEKSKIDQWCIDNPQRKVFISNGAVLSGQASNFSMAPVINSLATNYPDILFIITNHDGTLNNLSNIIESKKIIHKNDFDLNENAYLSTKCNLIVGRSSGAFTFAFNKTNLFGVGQTFISFSNLNYNKKFWLGDSFADHLEYKSKIISHNTSNINEVYRIIQENLP